MYTLWLLYFITYLHHFQRPEHPDHFYLLQFYINTREEKEERKTNENEKYHKIYELLITQ